MPIPRQEAESQTLPYRVSFGLIWQEGQQELLEAVQLSGALAKMQAGRDASEEKIVWDMKQSHALPQQEDQFMAKAVGSS